MKLHSILALHSAGILPYERFRRRAWSKSRYPNMFVSIDESNNMMEDDNVDGGGARYYTAGYDDMVATDWEWFTDIAWFEK